MARLVRAISVVGQTAVPEVAPAVVWAAPEIAWKLLTSGIVQRDVVSRNTTGRTMTKTAPVSIRLEADHSDKVAHIAEALDRPKSWVIEQAVRDFVAVQEWQLAAIDEGIKEADAGKLIPHEDVVAWVRSWGSLDELPMPKCE